MPEAVPFRGRPVLEHIVEQHAEEAAFLWTLRDAATEAPHYKRHHLARLDERVEAHVDGLRVAGEAGRRIAMAALEARPEEPGEMLAAAILALESGEMVRVAPIAALAEAAPPARRGLIGAIAWCRPALQAPIVRAWDRSARGFERYLAGCAYSVHRARAGSGLADRIEDEDPLVRARALRLAGEIGRVEQREACLRHLGDPDAECQFWAAWSAVLLGDRGAALNALAAAALAEAPRRWTALEVAVRAMGRERGGRFIGAMAKRPELRRTMVVAAGHFGDPVAVPWLIERMAEPELARVAGESFAMITGADVERDDLERDAPPEPSLPAGDDAGGAVPAADPDERLPWPDARLVRGWWEREGRRLAPGARHLLGRPIEAVACLAAWERGTQRQRRAAALELALAAPEAPLGNWRERLRLPA
jgi:uncharacterized protein (TIGR02270 family)